MNVLLMLVGLAVMLLGLLLSIALHECGHLLPAKRFGCLVPRYMVGLGPTLFSFARGGTEYGLKLLPFGGYCKILGMYGPRRGANSAADLAEEGNSAARSVRGEAGALKSRSRKMSLSDEARAANLEEIPVGSEQRAFYLLSVPKKLVVMCGGPVANLLLSAVFLALALFGVGVPGPSTSIGGLICPDTQGKTLVCTPAQMQELRGSAAPTPALQAGLQVGDRIVAWDGSQITTWSQLTSHIANAQGESEITVQRNGKEIKLHVDLHHEKLGIFPSYERFAASPQLYAQQFWQLASGTVKGLVSLPYTLYETVTSAFSTGERPQGAAMSIVGLGMVAGEIAAAPSETLDFPARVGTFLLLLASLNMALFVFNLLPLPPLDGGHIAGALWQGIKGRLVRSREPYSPLSPAYVDAAKGVYLTYTVGAILVLLSVTLIAMDIIMPVKGLF